MNAQIRTLGLLEASLDAGVIDLTQVDQFRQAIETERATLLQAENGLLNSIETFLRGTLGLPPDIPVTLDDSLIAPFQLIDSTTTELQDAIADLQDNLGAIGGEISLEQLNSFLDASAQIEGAVDDTFEAVSRDLNALDERLDSRVEGMPEDERDQLIDEISDLDGSRENLRERYNELQTRREALQQMANEQNARDVADQLVIWLRELLSAMQELSLVQARARLESVIVEPVDLDSETAFEVALANRLDLMNNRAALVDSWRLIQFNADALQSGLEVFFDGDLQTVGNNPMKFRGPAGSLRAGLRFDAPFTRLVERNNYRQQLIEYQQDRRQLIQSFDGVHQTVRFVLRDLEQLKVNLEIQRRATVIAIRRVDLTREDLNEPQAPAAPGEPTTQLGPTAAQNLLTALSDLRNTQNNFMSVYLNYYATRMRLARDLGIMMLDEEGRWIDEALAPETLPMGVDSLDADPSMIPPPIPEGMLQLLEEPLEVPDRRRPVLIEASARSEVERR